MAAGIGLRFAGRFLGNAVSESFAFAAGVAIGPVLGPVTQSLRNTVNAAYPQVPLAPGTLAEGVAQGQIGHDVAAEIASHSGISGDNFDHLVAIANVGPGSGHAFELWRRGIIGEPGFRRAVKRLGLEQEWIDDLVKIKNEILDPADLARAIHRGLIPDPGLLQGDLPSGVGNVPAYPVYDIDALAEALGSGIDRDRLGVLVGLQGLPMGSHEAAQALFRKVLTEDDYLRAIAEGNTRNEWAEAIREQSRQIPSVTNYVEARVRNWISEAEMLAGAARHGMTAKDTQLEFLIHGRPLSWHQVFIGLRRGGKYDGPTGEIAAPFLKALQESDIRPEWYNIAWAQRFNYPTAFVLRTLTSDGDISAAEAEQILLYEGWEPKFAATVSAKWAGGTTAAKQDPYIGKAQNQLWTATHKAFVKDGSIDALTADSVLTNLVTDAADRAYIMTLWETEANLGNPAQPPP